VDTECWYQCAPSWPDVVDVAFQVDVVAFVDAFQVVVADAAVVVVLELLGLVFVVDKSQWLLLVHWVRRLVGPERASWVEEEQPLLAGHREEEAAWTALAVRGVASW